MVLSLSERLCPVRLVFDQGQCYRTAARPVQYQDGQVGIVFLEPGQHINLNGRDSIDPRKPNPSPSYATDFSISNSARMAIINTMRGGLYGIGLGVAAGIKRGGACLEAAVLDDELMYVEIGDSCELPGLATTTAVRSVHFKLEMARIGTGGALGTAKQLEGDSPFSPLAHVLLSASQYLRPQ